MRASDMPVPALAVALSSRLRLLSWAAISWSAVDVVAESPLTAAILCFTRGDLLASPGSRFAGVGAGAERVQQI